MGRAHEGRSAADFRSRSRSARDRPQNLEGGKSRRSARPHPADVCLPLELPFPPAHDCGAPFSTLPEFLTSFTVSPSRSPLLTCLHSIAIFSLHTIQALSFSKKFFESHFLLFCLSHCIQYMHCVSQFFSLNHIFFCLSHHGNVSRAKFPVPDDDGFKLFTSLVHFASHSTSSSTQIQERLEK